MFSVIIPVHNKLPHLDRSINSVLKQTYQSFELILIDDASTDGSSEKLKEYDDPRIRVFERGIPGPGGYAARNLGIQEAKYEWIAFLDADDEWDLTMLDLINKLIDKNTKTDIFSFGYEEIEGSWRKKHIISKEKSCFDFTLIDYLQNTGFMLTGAIVVRRTLIEKAGSFPHNKICKRGGDVDTWIRWLDKSRKNIHLSKVLFYYYRDTVNRVTGNPNTYFCAYNTLIQIYRNNPDVDLRKSIQLFINKFIYNMLARQVRSEMAIDYPQIKQMYLSKYSVLRIIKLHLMKYKIIKK